MTFLNYLTQRHKGTEGKIEVLLYLNFLCVLVPPCDEFKKIFQMPMIDVEEKS